MTLLSFTYFMRRWRRKMADGDLGYFWLEYRNAVFTIVFLDPKNLANDSSPMFLSVVIVLEISWIEFFYWPYRVVSHR